MTLLVLCEYCVDGAKVFVNGCPECGLRTGIPDPMADILIGGNHLANVLIQHLGGNFSTHWPPHLDPDAARTSILQDWLYDVWCCWAAIMRSRDLEDRKPLRRDAIPGTAPNKQTAMDDTLDLVKRLRKAGPPLAVNNDGWTIFTEAADAIECLQRSLFKAQSDDARERIAVLEEALRHARSEFWQMWHSHMSKAAFNAEPIIEEIDALLQVKADGA